MRSTYFRRIRTQVRSKSIFWNGHSLLEKKSPMISTLVMEPGLKGDANTSFTQRRNQSPPTITHREHSASLFAWPRPSRLIWITPKRVAGNIHSRNLQKLLLRPTQALTTSFTCPALFFIVGLSKSLTSVLTSKKTLMQLAFPALNRIKVIC